MHDYIDLCIGRQLSVDDRRMLVNQNEYLTRCGLSHEDDTTDVGDGGYCARLIEQAVDLKLIQSRHSLLWKK